MSVIPFIVWTALPHVVLQYHMGQSSLNSIDYCYNDKLLLTQNTKHSWWDFYFGR